MIASTMVLAMIAPASASTLSEKRAQAAAVQAQIDTLNNKAEIAAENYNTARARHDRLTVQVRQTERRIIALQSKIRTLQSALGNRADAMYREGPLGFVEVLLSTKSFDDFNTTFAMITQISEQDAKNVSELKTAKAEAVTARTTLAAAQADATRQLAAMASNKAAVELQLSARSQVLAHLNAGIKTLIAQQQAADAAAARARYRALIARRNASSSGSSGSDSSSNGSSSSSSSGSSSGSSDSGGSPPTSSRGAAAVYWAEKALGRPYQWAAAGPGSFDCSGLVMWAYAHVGVSLPHSSGMQINRGSRVSRSNLQPGDLVFFGSPIHHVGMYVGGGDFIEAPHTGAVVRITSLSGRGDYAGACRP